MSQAGHFPGADDNASGTAMLLEVALHLSKLKQSPKRSIAFVGFALEEHLLWGSRWLAAHSPWPMKKVKFFKMKKIFLIKFYQGHFLKTKN